MQIEIELLGGFRVVADGRAIDEQRWSQRRSKDLVKLLALAPGHRLHREQVVAALWPHLSLQAGGANLHKAAHFARKVLGARQAVVLRQEVVRLWPGATIRTDVARFLEVAEAALAAGSIEACAGAADLYPGDLLPDDPYEQWALEDRERLRLVHLELLRRTGRWDLVIEADPADEEACLARMRAHLRAGDREGAVRLFQGLCAALGDLGVRPRPATIAVYEKAVADGAVARPPPPRAPILGRDDELQAAQQVLQEAVCGEGGTVLVEGALGMGKTRFTLEVVDRAAAGGCVVLRSGAGDVAPTPFAPVADAVQRLVRARPDLLALLPEGTRIALARLTGLPAGAGDRGEGPELSTALTHLLVLAAGTAAAVLSIDDAHRADDATIRLLHALANAARYEPIALVLGYRREEAPPALLALRRSLLTRRACVRLELGPLAQPAATALATRVAGDLPSPASLDTIWRLAEGNPFFTEELAASIAADGSVPTPGSLTELVASRLASLPPDLLHALTRMAIAGHPIAADDVAWLAEGSAPEGRRLLEAGLRAGVVVADAGRYRLRHRLVADALAHAVPAPQRWRLHGEVADRLIAAGAPAAHVVHHLAPSGRRETTEWFRRAAAEALAVSAYAEALAFADRGLDQGGPAVRPALLELRADALLALGDPGAAAAYGAVLAETATPADAALRIKRARACLAVGAVDAAERCLEGAGPPADHQASWLLVRGLIAWYRDDLEGAEALAGQARALALAEGSEFEVTEVLALEVMVAHTGGQRRLTSLSQWMEAYAAPGLASMALDPHLCVADYLLASDEPAADIIAFARQVAEATARSHAVRGQAFAALVLGEAELVSGALDAAEADLHQAIELHRRVGSVAGEVLAIEGLAELALQRQRPEEATRLFDEAEAASRWSPLCSHLLIRAHATRVRACPVEGAVDAVDAAEEALADHRPCPICSARFLVAAASACARAGRQGRAQRYLAQVEALGGPTRRGRLGAAVTAARAELALAEGRVGAAVRSFADAAGWYDELGHHPDARLCRERAAATGVLVERAGA